jgi:hypothetical protein
MKTGQVIFLIVMAWLVWSHYEWLKTATPKELQDAKDELRLQYDE